jgi:hypothetical protein
VTSCSGMVNMGRLAHLDGHLGGQPNEQISQQPWGPGKRTES